MRIKARYAWDRVEVSFWFAPAVMAVAAVFLVWVMYWIDVNFSELIPQDSRLIMSGPIEAMRASLITIATTTLGTAGIVFTLLTLPLSTVAAQYGSRLLRVFLGDRTTQFVLGMFVGTFVYCIAGALAIVPGEEPATGAQLTATVGLYLLLATFASLILLVQHISTMLQAPNIVAAAGDELLDVIFAEIPGEVSINDDSHQTGLSEVNALKESESFQVRIKQTGYIQYIDPESLLEAASDNDLVIRLLQKPGDFVWNGAEVALVWPPDRIAEPLDEQIRGAFRIGRVRTPTQDVEYAVNQLVEVAVRAMSPAINDPFTAMTCLDYIGIGLAKFIENGERPHYFYDNMGRLRLVYEPATFNELLNAAFDMIRHCSCDNANVLLCMLDTIGEIGQAAQNPAARQALLRHVNLVLAESRAGALIEHDRQLIQQRTNDLQLKFSGVS